MGSFKASTDRPISTPLPATLRTPARNRSSLGIHRHAPLGHPVTAGALLSPAVSRGQRLLASSTPVPIQMFTWQVPRRPSVSGKALALVTCGISYLWHIDPDHMPDPANMGRSARQLGAPDAVDLSERDWPLLDPPTAGRRV